MAVSPKKMRDTLRMWASGVTVVSTTYDGEQAGMTVSSFSSLCLEPPLIVVCLAKNTHTFNLLEKSRVFAVSVLHADQADLSDRFAGREPLADGENRFDGVPTFTAETGAPILQDAIACFDCRVFQIYDGVSHWIVVGETVAVDHRRVDNEPLLYFNRSYRELQPEPVEVKE